MRRFHKFLIGLIALQLVCVPIASHAQEPLNDSRESLAEMINDDDLSDEQTAEAVRTFKEKYASETFGNEKKLMEKYLIRRLNKTTSPRVQVEIFHCLVVLDRYSYFKVMVPKLIQKADTSNREVANLAYGFIEQIIQEGNDRTREARVVFNYLKKVFFLSRKRLEQVTEPDERLKQKLSLLRWSIKVLGTQVLNQLPPEVIQLLY